MVGLLIETHTDPARSLYHGSNASPLKHMKTKDKRLAELDRVVNTQPLLKDDLAA
jgi:3-deoxy-D-manno-octulosonic acid (KDO) 8-phosphate synthase